ncbi:MAG: YigZ family protein [Clostridia bacterium]|nr:YigZ family protein [Clostridia bacterium]
MQEGPRIQAYKTVQRASEIENVEKRSRFIGRCWPVASEAEALSILERIRKECWDATHNCYAYVLRGGTARYSDDGEPSGTAGMPMMEALNRIGVTDTLVIVTRYFGGILLGAGGLVRAYSKATCDAVRAAELVQMLPCIAYSVRCAYPYWNTVRMLCEQHGRADEIAYAEDVSCTVWVERTHGDAFVAAMTDRTEGRIVPEPILEDCFPFPAEVTE